MVAGPEKRAASLIVAWDPASGLRGDTTSGGTHGHRTGPYFSGEFTKRAALDTCFGYGFRVPM